MIIICQKSGNLIEAERLEIARLLIKAGYTVRIGRDKAIKGNTGIYIDYVVEDEREA